MKSRLKQLAAAPILRKRNFGVVMRFQICPILTTERNRFTLSVLRGSGMSGLAGLLIELGHAVSGSDKVTSTETERLQRLGLRFS